MFLNLFKFKFFILCFAIFHVFAEEFIIETEYGKLKGIKEYNSVAFKGVPYASEKTPRFSDPLPPEKWSGIKDVTKKSAIFPQTPGRLANIRGTEESEYSEGAFYVNIWKPITENKTKLPVIVFLHGGGFVASGGSENYYNSSVLSSEQKVVVVTVNYRLGALGNLYSPEHGINGNYSLKDIIFALNWVNKNINSFNGDENNVTVIGQSAGAWFVGVLAGMKETKNLFHKAVILSTVPSLQFLEEDKALEVSENFLSQLQENPKTANINNILAIQDKIMASEASQNMTKLPFLFRPVNINNNFSKVYEENWVKNTHIKHFIISTVREETATFYQPLFEGEKFPNPKRYIEYFASSVDNSEYYNRKYTQADVEFFVKRRAEPTNYNILIDISTDHIFRTGSLRYAYLLSKEAKNVYVIQFDLQSPKINLKAPHVIDVPFLFGNFEYYKKAPMIIGLDEKEMIYFSKKYRALIKNFVLTGDTNTPNTSTLETATISVKPYNLENNFEVLVLDKINRVEQMLPCFGKYKFEKQSTEFILKKQCF